MSLKVRDLRPGMRRVNLAAKISSSPSSRHVVQSGGLDHEILELEIGDDSGSIKLVLWDDKILPELKKDDHIKIENGFVTSFKGVWRINVGRYGTLTNV